MDQALYNLLLASFDRALSDEEQLALTQGLETSAELREEQAKLQQLRGLLSEQAAEFKPFFAGRVLHKIEALENKQKERGIANWMTRMFPKIAVSGIAVIVLLVVSTYFMEGSFSLDTLLGIAEVATEDADYYLIEKF